MSEYTVYKVARQTDHEGVYDSAIVDRTYGTFCRTYEIGKTTRPPAQCRKAPLFAYADLDSAKHAADFLMSNDFSTKGCVVLECVTNTAPVPLKVRASIYDGPGAFKSFWEGYDVHTYPVDPRSVGCRTLTPRRVVYTSRR